ncbi:MAG: type II secretion system protein [Planctomycetota bacterium]|nr:type II secretion system protein [Planctomycetota bacterium]
MPGSLQITRTIPFQGCVQPHRVPRRGYSLIELLVVMSVVTLLTGLLLPTLASIHDAANRVISKSNQRNIGQAIALFADSQQGHLPESAALEVAPLDLGELMRTWTPDQLEIFDPNRKHARWLSRGFDGLGRLFQQQYLKEPSVLYSPGHDGAHSWDEYEKNWRDLNQVMTARVGNEDINPGRPIYSNYHYAGHKYWDPDIDSSQWRDRLFSDGYASILLADGMRRSSDLNFEGGINVLHMDLSVEWLEDWQLSNVLPPDGENTIGSGGHVIRAMWKIFRPH